jgi:hypothetical protein
LAKRKKWCEKLQDSKDLPRVGKITERMSKKWGTGTVVIPAPRALGELPKNTSPIFSESKSSITLIQSAPFPRCIVMSFHNITVIISARAKVEAYNERRCLKLLANAEQNKVVQDAQIKSKYRNYSYVQRFRSS